MSEHSRVRSNQPTPRPTTRSGRASGGQQETGVKHRIVWGVILTAVIGTLLIAGKANGGADPMEALKNAMIIGALPFTMVMGLMCVSLGKAFYRDGLREKYASTQPVE